MESWNCIKNLYIILLKMLKLYLLYYIMYSTFLSRNFCLSGGMIKYDKVNKRILNVFHQLVGH